MGVIESVRPLAEAYDVALLDLDGVVYLGEQPIAGVPHALAQARAAGMRLAFVTNNASRTPGQVVALLARMGVSAQPAEVITSSHAAAHFLADVLPAGAAVLVIGTTGLIEAVADRGLRPVFSADDAPVAVVQGFSQDIGWPALAEGMVAIRAGARWVATNLDPSVPSPRGPLPGNGSLVAALRQATGLSPECTGKPDPRMHAESVQRSGARNPIVVGDRLDTDIEGAKRASCDSLLVLTGVTSAADLLAAPPPHRPEFVGRDAGALLVAHPVVDEAAEHTRCRRATVRIEGATLTLSVGAAATGPGSTASPVADDDLDPLRALAHAAWRAATSASGELRIVADNPLGRAALADLGLDQRYG